MTKGAAAATTLLLALLGFTGCGQAPIADKEAKPGPVTNPATPDAKRDPFDWSSIDMMQMGFDTAVDAYPEWGGKMVILCDPGGFRLSIRAGAAQSSIDRNYPIRVLVDPETLSQPLPNHGGESQYRGQLIRYLQCGPYTLRLRGGFYNSNTAGQLGAFPAFVLLQIVSDNRRILPNARVRVNGEALAIGICERGNGLAPDCPQDWAVRLDLTYDSKRGRIVAKWQTESVPDLQDYPNGEERTEQQAEIDRSLSMWENMRDYRRQRQTSAGTP